MQKKIRITWDGSGFAFEVDEKVIETDYCGLIREWEITTIKELLEHLGYEVEVIENYDCSTCKDEGCEDCDPE